MWFALQYNIYEIVAQKYLIFKKKSLYKLQILQYASDSVHISNLTCLNITHPHIMPYWIKKSITNKTIKEVRKKDFFDFVFFFK